MANKLLPKAAGSTHLLPYELFPKVGNLTFSQLSDLRHRGAFSTVSLTFAHCCQLTQDYGGDGQQANMLLQTWYQVIPLNKWTFVMTDKILRMPYHVFSNRFQQQEGPLGFQL